MAYFRLPQNFPPFFAKFFNLVFRKKIFRRWIYSFVVLTKWKILYRVRCLRRTLVAISKANIFQRGNNRQIWKEISQRAFLYIFLVNFPGFSAFFVAIFFLPGNLPSVFQLFFSFVDIKLGKFSIEEFFPRKRISKNLDIRLKNFLRNFFSQTIIQNKVAAWCFK